MVLTGMETTNEQRILKSCSCGWSNVTTYRGLRIHQGKAKCGGKDQRQTCTAQAGQTSKSQSRVEHHSVTDFTVADGHREVEQPHQQQAQSQQQAHSPEQERHAETPSSNPTRQAGERPTKVKWPKSIEKAAWESFDQDLHIILENSLGGSTITKLNLLGSESALGPDQKQACNPEEGRADPEAKRQEREGASEFLSGPFQICPKPVGGEKKREAGSYRAGA